MNAKKENTWRALADQDPIIDRWQCGWGWHRWTKWSDPYLPKDGDCNLQHGVCVGCDKVRVRRLVDQYRRKV